MLRYRASSSARRLATEYATPKIRRDFALTSSYQRRYQNVHNGREITRHLLHQREQHTRVDPMNARKMTALMQGPLQNSLAAIAPSCWPISVKGGTLGRRLHTQLVDDYADEMAFLWNETSGMQQKAGGGEHRLFQQLELALKRRGDQQRFDGGRSHDGGICTVTYCLHHFAKTRCCGNVFGPRGVDVQLPHRTTSPRWPGESGYSIFQPAEYTRFDRIRFASFFGCGS